MYEQGIQGACLQPQPQQARRILCVCVCVCVCVCILDSKWAIDDIYIYIFLSFDSRSGAGVGWTIVVFVILFVGLWVIALYATIYLCKTTVCQFCPIREHYLAHSI